MTIFELVDLVISNDQARILVALVLANLALGIAKAIADRTFTLVRLGDYARTMLIPTIIVYGVAALVSWAAPSDLIMGKLRDLVFATESAVLIGSLFASLKDLGINLPSTLAGK